MESERDELIAALVVASQALAAVAARSLDDLDERITLPQFRALVILGTSGPRRIAALATEVGIHRSSAQRLCERLTDAGLLQRAASSSGREVTVDLTASGRSLVDTVLHRRQAEIGRVVDAMTPGQRAGIIDALTAFSAAAGIPPTRVPEQTWSWGWRSGEPQPSTAPTPTEDH